VQPTLLITTEAIVAERPKKEGAAPAMPGGGMGGMRRLTKAR
jgi:chaperonin GroEL